MLARRAVDGINRCALVQKQLHCFKVPIRRGVPERRACVTCPPVNRCAFFQKQLQDFRVFEVNGGN